MFSQTQVFRQLLKRRENAIKVEKSQTSQTNNLYNESTFYRAFIRDLSTAKKEVIIYSPYVTKFRSNFFKQTIEKLRERNVDVFIFTRPLDEYESVMQPQIQCALKRYEELGVCIFYPGRYIHEKVAIIDREILWEGSLNILSHRASNEMMRRTSDKNSATEVMSYIGLNEQIAKAYQLKYEKLYKGLVTSSKNNNLLKIKIFLLGLTVPVVAWLIVSLIYLEPLQAIEVFTNLVRLLMI